MAALFISDLHLTPERAAPNQQLLAFLAQQTASGDALYILGDLFEYWVGDDDLEAPLHRTVVNALRATASRSVGLFFIAGNRDFLVGPAFMEAARVTPLTDGTSFDLICELDNGGPLSSQIDVDLGDGVYNVYTDGQHILRYTNALEFLGRGSTNYYQARLTNDASGKA